MLYDWANSAFYTTVVGALLGPYLISLAQADVGKTGVVLSLGPLGAVTALERVVAPAAGTLEAPEDAEPPAPADPS